MGWPSFFFFVGVKSVDATAVTVLMQCSLLWVVAFRSALRRRCPSVEGVLGVLTVVTVAGSFFSSQSTAEGTLNMAGFILVLLGLATDDIGDGLLELVSISENSSLSEKLRAILVNEVMKFPTLLIVFLVFEWQAVLGNGLADLFSVPFLSACMGSAVSVASLNIGIVISGTFYVSIAKTISVLVTYVIEVAILRTQRLSAVATLQLVSLTFCVGLVCVTEYKIVAAAFEGRRAALVSLRNKMSVMRSLSVPRTTQNPNHVETGACVDQWETDSGPVLEVVHDVPPSKIGDPEGSDVETHGADDVTVSLPRPPGVNLARVH